MTDEIKKDIDIDAAWQALWEFAEQEVSFSDGTIDRISFIETGMKKFDISLKNEKMA